MKAYLESYGCAHNKSDAAIIKALLRGHGVEMASSPRAADFIFVNTCGVLHTTELRMLSRIKELSRHKATLVVCGCLPRINEKAVRAAAPGAFLLCTNSIGKIPELLSSPRDFLSRERVDKLALACPAQGLVAAIQIGEGCAGNCSYCATKFARGGLHSYPRKSVVSAVESAVAGGAREVCLTSEDTGCYGMDAGGSLPELLEAVVAVEGDFRVRVGMMNPNHALRLFPGLADAMESEKIYKFVHIPVQSGSDRVLKEMKRNYTGAEFEKVVSGFRKAFPSIRISTDAITGFPAETKRDFEKTVSLLERVRPDVTNVSKFAVRPGTEAAAMKQLPTQEIKRRSSVVSGLARSLSLESNKRELGKRFRVFAVAEGRRGGVVARTPNYKQLVFDGVPGREYTVKAAEAHPTYIRAQRIK